MLNTDVQGLTHVWESKITVLHYVTCLTLTNLHGTIDPFNNFSVRILRKLILLGILSKLSTVTIRI